MIIPFDIIHRAKIESGTYKVVNGMGRPVRIICWDRKGKSGTATADMPIVGLVLDKTELVDEHSGEDVMTFTTNGCAYNQKSDLHIEVPDDKFAALDCMLEELRRYITDLINEKSE